MINQDITSAFYTVIYCGLALFILFVVIPLVITIIVAVKRGKERRERQERQDRYYEQQMINVKLRNQRERLQIQDLQNRQGGKQGGKQQQQQSAMLPQDEDFTYAPLPPLATRRKRRRFLFF